MYDGSRSEPKLADVAVVGDRIALVGKIGFGALDKGKPASYVEVRLVKAPELIRIFRFPVEYERCKHAFRLTASVVVVYPPRNDLLSVSGTAFESGSSMISVIRPRLIT